MKNVLDYFENTVAKYARKTAVDDGNILMTWEELQESSMKIGKLAAFRERTTGIWWRYIREVQRKRMSETI